MRFKKTGPKKSPPRMKPTPRTARKLDILDKSGQIRGTYLYFFLSHFQAHFSKIPLITVERKNIRSASKVLEEVRNLNLPSKGNSKTPNTPIDPFATTNSADYVEFMGQVLDGQSGSILKGIFEKKILPLGKFNNFKKKSF